VPNATDPALVITQQVQGPAGGQKLVVFANSTRPSAAASGAGAVIWNSDANIPQWSDGTNWRDANGVIV